MSLRLLQCPEVQYHILPSLPEGEAKALTKLIVSLSCRMIAKHIVYMRLYSESFPAKFFALASADESARSRALQWCKDAWDTLEIVRQASVSRRWLAELLDELLWTRSAWVMEILIGLREAEFAAVPPDILEELRTAAKSQGMSKSAEDMFGHLKSCMKAHPSGRLGRLARWHRAHCSGILERMDRQPLVVDSTAVAQAEQMPSISPSMFAAAACEFSLGDESKQSFLKTNSWPSPSQQNFFMVPMAWHSLRANINNLDRVREEWLSLLAERNSIFYKVDSKRAWWVLLSTQYGVLGCPVTPIKQAAFWAIEFPKGADFWEQLPIHDETMWRTTRVECLPPELTRNALREQGLSDFNKLGRRITICCPDVAPVDLATAAAQRAFANLTVPFLKKLWQHWDLSGSPPALEADLLRGLISHKLPDLDSDGVKQIMLLRTAKDALPFDHDLQVDDLDDAAQLIDEDDRDVMKKQVTKSVVERAAAPTTCKSAALDLADIARRMATLTTKSASSREEAPEESAEPQAKAARVLKRVPRAGDGDVSIEEARVPPARCQGVHLTQRHSVASPMGDQVPHPRATAFADEGMELGGHERSGSPVRVAVGLAPPPRAGRRSMPLAAR